MRSCLSESSLFLFGYRESIFVSFRVNPRHHSAGKQYPEEDSRRQLSGMTTDGQMAKPTVSNVSENVGQPKSMFLQHRFVMLRLSETMAPIFASSKEKCILMILVRRTPSPRVIGTGAIGFAPPNSDRSLPHRPRSRSRP